VALKEMSTVLDAEREALELETIPEYLSEPSLPSREAAVSMASKVFTERESRTPMPHAAPEPQGNHSPDELETLWPGLHHDLAAHSKKSPSFYIMVGFMGGAVASIVGVLGYFSVTQLVAHAPSSADKRITMTASAAQDKQTQAPPAVRTEAGGEVVVPASNQYQVQTGDTLAGIALKNYKRVSPRLLDQICKSNNLRNANVLSLGQKLALPEYHTQPAQVASAGQMQ
jgi:LysM repeat protein